MSAVVILLPGALVALGLMSILLAFRREYPRLDDALAALGDQRAVPATASEISPAGERLGAWWLRVRPVAPTPTLARRLQLKGSTLARFYTAKVAGAIAGFGAPLVLGLLMSVLGRGAGPFTLLVSIVLAVTGYFIPDLLLRREANQITEDATESLLSYFDLVTLERMANQSATQSLHSAASLSDNAVFVTIRAALDRSRLEQRMPYGALRDVGRQMELPALADLADVMRLDESGAALSGTLRARVRELRDAHLTAMKKAANDVSERMTVFMVIPSLVFGLLFLVPPLLKLVFG